MFLQVRFTPNVSFQATIPLIFLDVGSWWRTELRLVAESNEILDRVATSIELASWHEIVFPRTDGLPRDLVTGKVFVSSHINHAKHVSLHFV